MIIEQSQTNSLLPPFIADFFIEAEWKACYCCPSKEAIANSGKILVFEHGESKIVCLSSTEEAVASGAHSEVVAMASASGAHSEAVASVSSHSSFLSLKMKNSGGC